MSIRIKYIFISLFIMANSTCILGQEVVKENITPYAADKKFAKGNFEAALEDYLVLFKKDSTNEKYAYNIAICYLNTNISKIKAVSYLEKLIKSPKADPNTSFLLARAYQYSYKFDEALKLYHDFKKEGKGNEKNLSDVDRQIQFCINAKEIMKFPIDVTFENLGMKINSEYADYYPFVNNNESFIIFNTKREYEAAEKME